MKQEVISALSSTGLSKSEIESLVEVPKDENLGDYAFPTFALAKKLKKNPVEVAKDLAKNIKSNEFEKVEATGPYVNFFVSKKILAERTLPPIQFQGDKYGSSSLGRNKKIVIEMSSPNIAKPFGIGHLRSTIIGNSLAKIASFLGYTVTTINYLGDWGTPFGKLIAGYKELGNEKKFKKDPIKHLYDIYVEISKKEEYEKKGREWFKRLEQGDKEALRIWKLFKSVSLKEFDEIYKMLTVKFDVISGESNYNTKMDAVLEDLKKKKLLKESEGALIVDLEKYGLGVSLIQKSDGATLYVTRDLAAALDRKKEYGFDRMIYEVGAEQKLHFKQLFKILELLGYSWAQECVHVDHGLYLDSDGKKFSTRKGKTVFMKDILEETKELAREEIVKREKVPKNEREKRAAAIALAAIFYGDLKNNRVHDMIFDLERFLAFEGDTGPYLLYTYARAKSILSKPAKYQGNLDYTGKYSLDYDGVEKKLLVKLSRFPEIVVHAYNDLSPHIIANYAYELAQLFNEFYHSHPVIGSDNELFRLQLVFVSSQVLKNALSLLGIPVLEKM
ncbi:arginine--tRNA ligase [Candidatus Pacearchaeota archaeon]|nr:arginine--tRNA ligase [Candidatus Pacearchaeota archaeon]